MKSENKLLLIGLLGGMSLLVALLWVINLGSVELAGASSPVSATQNPVHHPHRLSSPFSLLSADSISCTLQYTTTDKAPFGNHSFETAASLSNYTGQSLIDIGQGETGAQNATYETRSDFYRLDNAQLNYRYTVRAVPEKTVNYDLGIIVYDQNRRPIYTDSNPFDGNSATITFESTTFPAFYFFEVFQRSEQCEGETYSLILSSAAPTGTPQPTNTATSAPTTATPIPTWPTGFDKYEPNYDFNWATTIASGVTYDLNFRPWGGADVDNDFFKIRVKPGLQLTCQTQNLDPGVDPRMVFYRGPGESYYITANDDIALGDFNSRISFYSDYEGFLYILVGQGDRMDFAATANSNYQLRCDLTAAGTTTPAPGKDPTVWPTATPTQPSSPIATPTLPPATTPATTPTPIPNTDLTFQLLTTPTPATATPPPSGFRTFRVLVYYDENQDTQPGAGEGIPGFFIRVLSPTSGEELAQGYTDDQGQLSFTVPTVGTVRVLIPLLGFDAMVEATVPEVTVRIVPLPLPESIP